MTNTWTRIVLSLESMGDSATREDLASWAAYVHAQTGIATVETESGETRVTGQDGSPERILEEVQGLWNRWLRTRAGLTA